MNSSIISKKCKIGFHLLVAAFLVISCNDDEPADRTRDVLMKNLKSELEPLTASPNDWSDDQLRFLDPLSKVSVVGLGEATHGTAEFFQAKHRIFRYLVENHGFKIFAIEADFGESIFLNQAILASDKLQVENLMRQRMIFWTWKTIEVRDFLFWMCDYNKGKSESEKLQYWGVDCQYNTFHPDLLINNLENINLPFKSLIATVAEEAKSAAVSRHSDYTKDSFDAYIERVQSLKDSLANYKKEIIETESESLYDITLQLVELIRQASEVMYDPNGREFRDLYMAKNTRWVYDYFNGQKIVVWAHNFHVSNDPWLKSMGYHLKADLLDDYAIVGFLFSKGTFTAVSQNGTGNQFGSLRKHSLESEPIAGSANDLMSDAGLPAFEVKISDLNKHIDWRLAFQRGIEYFQVGAVYNNKPSNYYRLLVSSYYDRIIYIDRSTAANQLK